MDLKMAKMIFGKGIHHNKNAKKLDLTQDSSIKKEVELFIICILKTVQMNVSSYQYFYHPKMKSKLYVQGPLR